MLGLGYASATVTTFTAFGVGERLGFLPLYGGVLGDDHLGDAFAVLDGEGFLSVIDQQHFDFTAVVGIDGTRTVEHGDAVFEGEAAARPYLRFIPFGQFNEQSGGNKHPGLGHQHDGFF